MSATMINLLRLLRDRAPRLLPAVLRSGLPLFVPAMLVKLALFNNWIDVQYMEMDAADAVIAAGTLLLLSGWTLLLPVRARLVSLAALNILLTLILYADLLYFRYFQDLISVPVLLQARQVGSLGGSIAALLEPNDALLFLDWPVAALLPWLKLARKRGKRAGTRRAVRAAVCAAVCAAGFLMTALPIHEARTGWAKGLFGADWWNVSIYNVVGLYGFHAYDAYQYMKRQYASMPLAAEAEAESADWFAQRGKAREALSRDDRYGAYSGKNVIMIQVEALQSFVIGREWNGQPVTPRLNELLGESVYFERFYHQTAQGRTSDAEFAAQCSLHPLASGSVYIRHADRAYDCLPGMLKEAGYATAAFHAYDGGFWNRNVMYDRIGFDAFYSKKHFVLDEPLGWSLGDRSFLRQSAERIERLKQPFYAFLVTLSSHHPYALPASAGSFDAGEFEGTIFGDYLAAVHYADAALGEFVDRLKASGLWDDSIVVIYGDHDNSIAEWPQYEQFLGRPLKPAERLLLMREVPLILHLPDGAMGGEVRSEPGGQLDIAPTILHLLGMDTGSRVMAGLPLLADREHNASAGERLIVFRSGSFTDGQLYYTARPPEEGGGLCYDAQTGDPLPGSRCEAAKSAAEEEIIASARVVEHGLIDKWRHAEAASTKAKTADRFG
ncbi:MAG: phosphoglycerol transferase [Thermobacillus sp.]|uniref:LTA synthase family protein n=1 Tax=Thermobacillus sp. TaxID=2108467 RepID=UPI000E37CC56|nr:LTA synthase family protein [Thermobacillus sp.]REK59459.1 MAG: phosphoglycerol transferase [Thermobacillus sp.]